LSESAVVERLASSEETKRSKRRKGDALNLVLAVVSWEDGERSGVGVHSAESVLPAHE
jgi:hypothetical protein